MAPTFRHRIGGPCPGTARKAADGVGAGSREPAQDQSLGRGLRPGQAYEIEGGVKNSCGTPGSGGGRPGHLPDTVLTLCPCEANAGRNPCQLPPLHDCLRSLNSGSSSGQVCVDSDGGCVKQSGELGLAGEGRRAGSVVGSGRLRPPCPHGRPDPPRPEERAAREPGGRRLQPRPHRRSTRAARQPAP